MDPMVESILTQYLVTLGIEASKSLWKITAKTFRKRFLKIEKEILTPETKDAITTFLKLYIENPDNQFLKAYNLEEILKKSIIDFEVENSFKKKLLNQEIINIVKESNYKYVYSKITVRDLELLKIIGSSIEIIVKKLNLSGEMNFFPTYSLLDIKNISFINKAKKELKNINETDDPLATTLHITSTNIFNKYKFNGREDDIKNICKIYKKYLDSIFNLINIGLLVYLENDNELVPSTEIKAFRGLHPFALSLTNKGNQIYLMIKNI